MKSRVCISFLFLSLGLFIAGCGSDPAEPAPSATPIAELAATESDPAPTPVPTSEPEVAGPIRVGVNANSFPPLTIIEGVAFSGFEIDIATEIIMRLRGSDAQIEWIPITAAQRFSALAAGQIDMLVSATLHTTSREEQALFSGSYLLTGNSFLVYQDEGYSSVEDLDGESIATLIFMTDGLNEVTDALGITLGVIVFESIDEALLGIGIGDGFRRAAALYLDWVQLAGFMDPAVHALIMDGSSLGPIAVAFPLGEEDLRDEVNNVQSGMIADGTWQSIFDTWFGIEVPWNVEEMFDFPPVDR